MTWFIHGCIHGWSHDSFIHSHVMRDVYIFMLILKKKFLSWVGNSLIFDRSSSASICHAASWSSSLVNTSCHTFLVRVLSLKTAEIPFAFSEFDKKNPILRPLLKQMGWQFVFHQYVQPTVYRFIRYPSQLKNRCPSNHWDWSRRLPIEPVASGRFWTRFGWFGVPQGCLRPWFPQSFLCNFQLRITSFPKEMRGCLFTTNAAYQRCSWWYHKHTPVQNRERQLLLAQSFQVHPFTLRRMRTPLRLASSIRDGNSCLSFRRSWQCLTRSQTLIEQWFSGKWVQRCNEKK